MSDARLTPSLATLLEHRSWVRAVARRLVHDEHGAADLEQDAWVAALRRPPDGDRDPRPWLRRVLANLASNRRRAAGRRDRRERAWRDARSTRTPAEAVVEAEQHRRVVALVLELEEPFKTTLVLRFYEGLAPGEIAERLGVPIGTVHSRLARAIDHLRARLDAQEGGERMAWMAALLPLASVPTPSSAAPPAAVPATSLGILVMALAKPPIVLVATVLLACFVGGGLWIASRGTPDGGTGEPPRPALAAAGTPVAGLAAPPGRPVGAATVAGSPGVPAAATAPAETARPPVRGRVVDARGRPVAGAMVFALPRDANGVEEEELRDARYGLATTDETGAFATRPGVITRPRLVAQAEGHLPGSVSLTGAESGSEVEIVLGDPWVVTVRFEGTDGAWPADCTVHASTEDDDLARFTADPSRVAFLGELHPQEGVPAERRITAATRAPLFVEVDPPEGRAAVPSWVRLEHPASEASFRLVRASHVTIRATDAVSGELLPEDVEGMGQVSDPVRGILLDSGGLSEGRIRFDSDLAPGTYDVALAASGWIPWRGKAVVRSAGSEVEVTAALQRRPRAQGKGSVVVRTREAVPAPEAVARSPRTPAAAVGPEWCCVLLRRSGDTAWRDARAEERPDGSLDLHALNWSTAEGVSSAGIEEGSYDLLVARRDRGMAGMVRGVRIVGDRENLVDVPLRPGCVFRLTDLVDRDVAYRSVEVRCTEHGTLPLYALPPLTEGGFREEQTLRALLRVPLEPIELGPFPATEVEVVVTDAEGRARSFRAGGAR